MAGGGMGTRPWPERRPGGLEEEPGPGEDGVVLRGVKGEGVSE